MLEQISNSIKATLYDRVSSPLSSSFIISWCLWNYKILIVLFSSMKPYEKYNAIDILVSTTVLQTSFYEPLGYWLTNGVAFPFLSALAYIYIYPIPAKIVYRHHLEVQGDLKRKRNEIENNEVLTLDDSLILRQEILGKDKYYVEVINSKNKDIEKNGIELKELLLNLNDVNIKNKELIDKALELDKLLKQRDMDLNTLRGKYQLLESDNVNFVANIDSLTRKLSKYENNEDLSKHLDVEHINYIDETFPDRLSFEIFSVIVESANEKGDGAILEVNIYKYIDTKKWSKIAVDAAMSSLKNMRLITIGTTSKSILLTDSGKHVAVKCGLA
ncbi:hypothetical protein [Shewanella decolorationis]|uniref:hypothetical protein n=1 Tax=Shewanella decolorationis TaxID=256839 RepID=UPI0010575462|nr:hypothetical protein [Shewanella decolorationis]